MFVNLIWDDFSKNSVRFFKFRSRYTEFIHTGEVLLYEQASWTTHPLEEFPIVRSRVIQQSWLVFSRNPSLPLQSSPVPFYTANLLPPRTTVPYSSVPAAQHHVSSVPIIPYHTVPSISSSLSLYVFT